MAASVIDTAALNSNSIKTFLANEVCQEIVLIVLFQTAEFYVMLIL